MKEVDWAKQISNKIERELLRTLPSIRVEACKKLIYANEIREYGNSTASYNEMAYETDILVYELLKNTWRPRVAIETKIERITTHDAITYSQKSSTHKSVHPYLRYGILLGKRSNYPLPGRLFRHGAYFDFMLSWEGYKAKSKEWKILIKILKLEIEASRKLEEMFFKSRNVDRKRYYALHKPLITEEIRVYRRRRKN